MEPLRQAVARAAAGESVVVLPSEVAAAFWRREATRSGPGTIREDSVVSWDLFKESVFGMRSDRAPVNRALRAAFADALLRENAGSPFLRRMVPPEFAATGAAFASQICQSLQVAPELIDRRVPPAGSLPDAVADLKEIVTRYRRFLDRHGLFEPAWLPVGSRASARYTIAFPELIGDYPRYESALVACPTVSVRPANATLRHFPDSRSELSWVFGSVEDHLEGGLAAEEMAITVCDLERRVDVVAHEAERRSVPVSIRAGTRLSDSAVGRFLASIGEAASRGFGVDSLKRLLLNRAVPWTDYPLCSEVVRVGVRLGCIGGPSGEPRWERLRGEASKFLQAVMQLCRRITAAKEFRVLSAALEELLSRFVAADRWEPLDLRVLQRSREVLRGLVAMAELGVTVSSPYRFWLDRLAEVQYVAQRSGGVPVYPYRVAAGICPRRHYVVGATERGTVYRVARFPFLTDLEQRALGESERDLTGAFLAAYARSGHAVVFTAPRESEEGTHLPSSWFFARRAVEPVGAGELEADRTADRYLAEERFQAISPAYALQSRGLAAYLATGPRAGIDLTRRAIADPPLRSLVVAAVSDRERPDLLRISSSSLDAWRSCRFSFLLTQALGVEEPEVTIDPDSPRDIGTLYHRILQRFYDGLRDAGRFSAAEVHRYAEELSGIVNEEIARGKGAIDVVLRSLERRILSVVEGVLRNDAELIDGDAPVSIEGGVAHELHDAEALLVGRFDRVTRARGGVTLVDYKKNRIPAPKEINGGSSEPLGWRDLEPADRIARAASLAVTQLPFYVALLESHGERVRQAAYYSLEGEKRSVMVSDSPAESPAMSRERLDEIVEAVMELIGAATRSIRAGDFRCPPQCDGCGLRQICRTRYVVR